MAVASRKRKTNRQLARDYADRIVLSALTRVANTIRLGELALEVAEYGISLEQLKQLLATNPDKYVYYDRRWHPKARIEAMEAPVNEHIRLMLEYAGPMHVEDVESEIILARGKNPIRIKESINDILNADPKLFATQSGIAGLREWLFQAYDESPERAIYINDLDENEIKEYSFLKKIDFFNTEKIIKEITKNLPLPIKIIGFYAWRQLNPPEPYTPMLYNSVELFDELLTNCDAVYGSDGMLYPETQANSWLKTAIKEAEGLQPIVEIEEAAPLEFGAAEIAEMADAVNNSTISLSISNFLHEKYDLTPMDRTYPEDLTNAVNALKNSGLVWWVGGDRFRRPDSAPEYIYMVPEFFQFPISEYRDEDGQLIDVELSDDGFTSALRKEMALPLAMDVLDEDPLPVQKKLPDSIRLVLKSLHREIGTFPMCQFPTGWLSEEPKIQELVFVDENNRQINVWVNHEARLLYNLLDWWFEQPIESGAVFTLTKTALPNVFEFRWQDEVDTLLYIPSERMEELRDLAGRASELSTYEIIMEVLSKHSKGADFLTVLAETNVVRRTTRRLVASILSGYHCFYQRSGSPLWHFDNKKVAQGFDKTKQKFARHTEGQSL